MRGAFSGGPQRLVLGKGIQGPDIWSIFADDREPKERTFSGTTPVHPILYPAGLFVPRLLPPQRNGFSAPEVALNMHSILLIVIATFFFIPPVLYAVVIFQTWHKEGSLRPHTRGLVAAGLLRLAILLIGVAALLTASGRVFPNVLFILIILLYLASIGIRVVGVVNRLLVLLVGVSILLGVSQRAVPAPLVIIIWLLVLASTVIWVRDAIKTARNGSGGARTHPTQG